MTDDSATKTEPEYYLVVEDSTMEGLAKKVNKLMADGYSPLGGITSVSPARFAQALTRLDVWIANMIKIRASMVPPGMRPERDPSCDHP